jgi:hypothetical protein
LWTSRHSFTETANFVVFGLNHSDGSVHAAGASNSAAGEPATLKNANAPG